MYKVIVQNLGGTLKWDLPYNKFSFSEILNQDRDLQVEFNIPTLNAIAGDYGINFEYILTASYREIYVYSDDTVIYGGYISDLNINRSVGNSGTVTVASKGFFSLLKKRYTQASAYRTYTAEDSADIAWDLIDYTQGKTYGDLGITRGTHPTTKDRDRTLLRENIGEVIEGMSASNVKEGYDFEIDEDKIFNIYYPEKGSIRTNIVLSEDFNIKSYSIRKTFVDSMVNQVHVVGDGFGIDSPVETRDSNATYKSNFFLLEGVLAEKSVRSTTTLQDKGDAYLDKMQAPQYFINISTLDLNPVFTDYEVGDRLRIVIDTLAIDRYLRLVKRTLNASGEVFLGFEIL
jgi:hypothetical protein